MLIYVGTTPIIASAVGISANENVNVNALFEWTFTSVIYLVVTISNADLVLTISSLGLAPSAGRLCGSS